MKKSLPTALALPFASMAGGSATPQSKPKKRKKKPKPPPVWEPLDCALLCADAALNSGWSIWQRGTLLFYGEVDLFSSGPREVFERFLALPGPHVLVVERPYRMRFGSQMAMGAGQKVWCEHAKRRRFGKRVVRVFTSTWRSCALGKGWGSARREVARPKEHEVATLTARQHLGMRAPAIGSDAAPAICMGKWATHAGEVLAVLPKRRALVKGEQLALVRAGKG